jgi:molybdopterin-guanine dinucleotide biosynthesis protein MobB
MTDRSIQARIPVLGLAAYSGTGKTTLLTQLIPLLRERGLRIAMIKRAHHAFDVDQPGKDSYELRKAGASQMLITSDVRWALMTDLDRPREPQLAELIAHIDQDQADLILVEGFKHEAFPKIELHRREVGKPLLYPADSNIIAIATDAPESLDTGLPLLSINDPAGVADFIMNHIRKGPAT